MKGRSVITEDPTVVTLTWTPSQGKASVTKEQHWDVQGRRSIFVRLEIAFWKEGTNEYKNIQFKTECNGLIMVELGTRCFSLSLPIIKSCGTEIFQINRYREELETYWQVDCHPNISSISEITLGETKAYVFFERNYGDLHSYVRQKKRLKEEEASRLFEQISDAVYHCHENGIVLRDLKLRKFVFKNPERTQLRLDGLEDACVLEDEADDRLADKHGCPAYVSPEILHTSDTYSGRSADIWSLGVMLYTMLVGRYPFHDSEPSALFGKIRRGQFTVPQMLSSKAKCLIKSLLRREPTERLTAGEVLQHPWVQGTLPIGFMTIVDHKNLDQTVPSVILHEPEDDFFV